MAGPSEAKRSKTHNPGAAGPQGAAGALLAAECAFAALRPAMCGGSHGEVEAALLREVVDISPCLVRWTSELLCVVCMFEF